MVSSDKQLYLIKYLRFTSDDPMSVLITEYFPYESFVLFPSHNPHTHTLKDRHTHSKTDTHTQHTHSYTKTRTLKHTHPEESNTHSNRNTNRIKLTIQSPKD